MSLTGVVHDRSETDDDTASLPAKKKRDLRSRNWFLTWNNYQPNSIGVLLSITGLVKYVIQEEIGENGTPHLQGVMCFKHAKLWSTLRGHAEIYWKPARNIMACKQYCSKIETSNGKLWVKGFTVASRVIDPLNGKQLYGYQKEIIDMCVGVADDRRIYWYWSDKGGDWEKFLV